MHKILQTSENGKKPSQKFDQIQQATRNATYSSVLITQLDLVDGNNEHISKNINMNEDAEEDQHNWDKEYEMPYQSSPNTRFRSIKFSKNSTSSRISPEKAKEPWVFPVGKFGRVVGAAPIPISNVRQPRNLQKRKEKPQIHHEIRSIKG